MKKIRFVLGIVITMFLLSSCTLGIFPVAATNQEIGSKVGVSTSSYLFGLFPLKKGEGGVAAAAKNGGISKVSTVDVQTKSYIIIIDVVTTVTGE